MLTRLGVAATLLVGPAVSLVGMAAIGLAPSAAAIAGGWVGGCEGVCVWGGGVGGALWGGGGGWGVWVCGCEGVRDGCVEG